MNCLPFIKRVANLRSVELQTPSDLNKQVFFSEKRKQRNSTDSGFSSTTDGNHLDLHSTRTPMWRNSISESGSSISTDDSTIKDEYCTTGYDDRRQLHTYLDQASKTWDDSTVFSLSNQKEIDIYLDGTNDYIGISIVGHNFENGDASLFIGAVIPGGAVSRDGRIQAGDLLLDINGNSLDGMSSRDAVAMLRQAVQHRRMVTLTVVGSWDDESVYSERSCVRPIDPMQWLAHNNFIYNQSVGLPGNQQKYFNSKSQMSIVSSSLSSSMPSTAARYRSKFHQQAMPLETPTDIVANRLRLHLIDQSNNAQKVTGNQKKSKTSIFGMIST
ncbi:dsh-2 [Bugula neritina]|uniref:Dsh-2 n=1 Tax=Bugula neritina TaxID=10212 RepID=A0A7J7J8D1_BUGNE|nr:dsh-2 [Bugula neritina]